jgi:hypothetical protein
VGFQVNGNTFIDNTGSAIFNANTSVANNFSVQLTPFASRESTSPMQGTVAGFNAGGRDSSPPPVQQNLIDRFPFANELNSTDHGDLSEGRDLLAGNSSDTDGFTSGGYGAPLSPTTRNTIDKYAFASNVTASDHGDLTEIKRQHAGHSSATNGYTSGGNDTAEKNTIEKFPFASISGGSDVGDLATARRTPAGQSSTNDGYSSGGRDAPGVEINSIEKFPFAVDTNATDIADITQARQAAAGISSSTHGYTSGGIIANPPGAINTNDKFPFSSDSDAFDVGDLVVAKRSVTGQNSREFGYVSGGSDGSNILTGIERFPFATDTNASDIGDLTLERSDLAGAQD